MKNYLKKFKRDLLYIAKRNKNIKFSFGLVLIYLMLGVNAFSEGTAVENRGNITFVKPILKNKPSVAMFSRKYAGSFADMKNSASIVMGANSIAMYGHRIENVKDIKVGDKGTAIYSMGGISYLE